MGDVVSFDRENARVALRIRNLKPVTLRTRSGRTIAVVPAWVTVISNRPDQFAEIRVAGKWRKIVLDMTFEEAVAVLTPAL